MIEPVHWVIRRVGGLQALILTLFAVALASMALTLSAVVRGLDPYLLGTMTIVGAASGWLLARSRVHPFVTPVTAILIALVSSFLRVGQLGDRIFAVLATTGQTIWNIQFGQFHTEPPAQAIAALGGGVAALVTRLQGWSRALASGQAVYEPVAMALVWSFVVCLVGMWAAWKMQRDRRPFEALLPLVLLLALVIAYSGRDTWVMFIVLGMWLGLMVALPYFTRRQRWERDAFPYAEGLGFDIALITVPVILIILTAAITIPAFSPESIARWVRDLTGSDSNSSQMISTSFGIEPAPAPRAPTALDRQSSPGLPRSHLLGASPGLLQKLALTVQVEQAPDDVTARYWLATTYDEYSGRGWYSSGFREQDYRAGERIASAAMPADRVLEQTVRVENFSGIVYAAGNLASVDKNFQVAWRQPQDMFGAQVNANPYRATSFVPHYDADTLRTAGELYPPWIGTQYLRVPNDLPPRIVALARDLTAAEPTPYDRARALENYLRTIPYSLDVPTPPTNRDVVDYFLFDLKRGYCDYYATAMAVLARAAGLPSRVAVGYAAGEYDATTRTYRVLEANAHSWTQIYFPNYGWIDFEPTQGRAPSERDVPIANSQMPPISYNNNAASYGDLAQTTLQNSWFLLPGILLFAGLVAWAISAGDTLLLQRASPANTIHILYQRIIRCAQFIGLPVASSHTPDQIGALLDEYFAARAGSRRLHTLWIPISPVLRSIIALYVYITYGANELTPAQTAGVIEKWKTARVRLGLALALNFLQETRERFSASSSILFRHRARRESKAESTKKAALS